MPASLKQGVITLIPKLNVADPARMMAKTLLMLMKFIESVFTPKITVRAKQTKVQEARITYSELHKIVIKTNSYQIYTDLMPFRGVLKVANVTAAKQL